MERRGHGDVFGDVFTASYTTWSPTPMAKGCREDDAQVVALVLDAGNYTPNTTTTADADITGRALADRQGGTPLVSR